MTEAEFKAAFANQKWRLNNLYYIVDKAGDRVKFTMNAMQHKLYDNLHGRDLVLKARQLGASTFIQIFGLDCALFNTTFSVGTIADTQENADNLIDKAKFAYDNLSELIKEAIPLVQRNQRELIFGNGSLIRSGVSLRSGTYQFLHVSEYGKICAKDPGRAKEIKSGAMNTVPPWGYRFIESTAEGRSGDFYDKADEAEKIGLSGREPGELENKFHFFPWYMDPAYTTESDIRFTTEETDYFADLKDKGITLTDGQKRWYAAKAREQGDDMWKEFPSTPDEAFKAVKDGAYFAKELFNLRQRKKIGQFEPVSGIPVNTFWDLGLGDYTSIWLHQQVAGRHRFIGYFEASGEGMAYYFDWLDKWRARHGAKWGIHFGPHDIDKRQDGSTGQLTTRLEIARSLGYAFRKVERTADKRNSIQAVRTKLPECDFDETGCGVGITHLEAYSRDWDDNLGVWKSHPRHDEHSHAADAFMTFADGYAPPGPKPAVFKPRAVI